MQPDVKGEPAWMTGGAGPALRGVLRGLQEAPVRSAFMSMDEIDTLKDGLLLTV